MNKHTGLVKISSKSRHNMNVLLCGRTVIVVFGNLISIGLEFRVWILHLNHSKF